MTVHINIGQVGNVKEIPGIFNMTGVVIGVLTCVAALRPMGSTRLMFWREAAAGIYLWPKWPWPIWLCVLVRDISRYTVTAYSYVLANVAICSGTRQQPVYSYGLHGYGQYGYEFWHEAAAGAAPACVLPRQKKMQQLCIPTAASLHGRLERKTRPQFWFLHFPDSGWSRGSYFFSNLRKKEEARRCIAPNAVVPW